LVWRARYDVLLLELAALTGSPVSRKPTFEPAFERKKNESIAFVAVLNCILANIEHATVLALRRSGWPNWRMR
jgi:hypothetical protein